MKYLKCIDLVLLLLFSTISYKIYAEEKASFGVTKDRILIGQSSDLSSTQAVRVKGLLAGAKLYFDKVNANNGIYGRKIELVVYDDGYEPERTLSNTKKLLEQDKVFALFKYYGTPTVKAALAYIESLDVPLICPSSGADFLRVPPKKNVFVTKGGYSQVAEDMVEFAVNKKKHSKIAVFYQDDAFGNDGRNFTNKALENLKSKVVAEGGYVRNTTDVTKAYKEIKKGKPDVVLLWGLVKPSIELIKKFVENKDRLPIFMGETSLANSEFINNVKELGAEAYLILGTPLLEDTNLKIVQNYISDATAAKEITDVSGLEGYIDAMILTEALKAAGKDLTREKFKSAFEQKLQGKNLYGLKMGFSGSSHQALSKNYVVKISDAGLVRIHN